ncbi:hypothetical protein HZB78_04465 [Candidatus Collierbacteria bacterium]|nr:hypothetical protein [Candidatus Collierbacteria bacterium]
MFYKADTNFMQKYGAQLVNHNGANYSGLVIKHLDKNWIFKSNDNINVLTYEILTFFLGTNLVNVTEIKPLSTQELEILNNGQILGNIDLSRTSSFLTRIAQDYSLDELPLKDLDSAVAGELVFSTLIRRRDTHEYNRAYVSYVPVFFDHGVSFEDQDATTFFSRKGKGFAGSWRVKVIERPQLIDTIFRKESWGDNHYILNKEHFISEVKRIAKVLKDNFNDLNNLQIPLIDQNEERNRIVVMIKKNLQTTNEDVNKMLEIVFDDD